VPLAACALSTLSAWTPLATLLPGLGVLRGPLGLLLVAFGLIATCLRWRAFSPLASLAAARPGLLFVTLFLLDASVGWHYVRGIQASGDEVEYLMLSQSLWREHDLDLADEFERGDHLEYTPGMGAMPFGTFRADGRPVTTHSPGLPLLLAPVYALGGRAACVLLLAALAAWLALETWRLTLLFTSSREASALAWLMVAGPPAFFYSFHMYSEVPSALAAIIALRLLLSSPGVRGALAAALLTAALPWLHVKMIPAAAVLGLIALVRLKGRARVTFVAVAALMGAAYLGFYWQVYGAPTPLALYGSKLPKKVKRADPLEALMGMFLDGAYGLFPVAPVFVLGLAGAFALRHVPLRGGAQSSAGVESGLLAALIALTAGELAPLLAWQTWWAGHCPPARFLVPLAPLLALMAALKAHVSPTGLTRWRGPLLGFGFAFALFMSLPPGEHLLLNDHGEPPRAWELLGGQPSVSRYLPLLTGGETSEMRVALVWAALLALLLLLDAVARKRASIDRLFGAPWLPVGLWLSLTTLVEVWARRE
jgi:hypothetical protein